MIQPVTGDLLVAFLEKQIMRIADSFESTCQSNMSVQGLSFRHT